MDSEADFSSVGMVSDEEREGEGDTFHEEESIINA